jgi:hypothetical protein
MKNQLEQLYTSSKEKFTQVVKSFPDRDIAGPLLISPNERYEKQKRKLLIVGQETNGWGYFSNDIAGGMELYEDFNLGINYYSSPFWNVTRKLERLIGNDEYSCTWTNLSKFDVDAKSPKGDCLEKISELDHLLTSEIQILKPDLIVFFTGPFFDYRINGIFQGVQYNKIDGFTVRQFAKLEHNLLNVETYRTYHPKSLRIQGIEERFLNQMEKITKHNNGYNK